MGTQTTVADTAALIAPVRSLARFELESESPENGVGAEVLADNRFLAARHGLGAQLGRAWAGSGNPRPDGASPKTEQRVDHDE